MKKSNLVRRILNYKQGWQCGSLCQTGAFSVSHWSQRITYVWTNKTCIHIANTSFSVQLQMMTSEQGIDLFKAHLSPSEALSHGNKRAIRQSWLMAAITISWSPIPPPICPDMNTCNLCNLESLLVTTLKTHVYKGVHIRRSEDAQMGQLMALVTFLPISEHVACSRFVIWGQLLKSSSRFFQKFWMKCPKLPQGGVPAKF